MLLAEGVEIKVESAGEEGGGIGGSDLCCYGNQIKEHLRIQLRVNTYY